MLLLITDTSGKQGSVALVRADESEGSLEVIEQASLAGGAFSAQIVPQVASLLARQNLTKRDIDAFIAVSGPGSFTGLRVGLAAIKALAEILQKPIVPVSLLEVIACATEMNGNVLAAFDAGRGEVYSGEYQLTHNHAKLCDERLLSKSEFLASARPKIVATPDESLAEIVRDAGIAVILVAAPDAEMIAKLGWRKLQAGETVTPKQLEANYIRRSDAELFVKTSS